VGDFEPIIELKTSLNLRISPEKYFSNQHQKRSRLARWFSMMETETLLKIDEKSKEEDTWAIYLLDLSKFQQDSTTIDGRITLRQDLFLFPRQKEFNLRLRYERSDDENNQLVTQGSSVLFSEERLRIEESVRLRSKLTRRFDLQSEIKVERNMRKVQDLITYDIRSRNFSADVGFRPQPRLKLSLKCTYDMDVDRESDQRSRAVSLMPSVSYSILNRGRARANISWTHVSAEHEDLPLYYTMAGGKTFGNNVDWSFNLDYRLHRYVTVLISYTGLSEPDRPVIHSGRAEMRAFF
jgi:hypothetical protein